MELRQRCHFPARLCVVKTAVQRMSKWALHRKHLRRACYRNVAASCLDNRRVLVRIATTLSYLVSRERYRREPDAAVRSSEPRESYVIEHVPQGQASAASPNEETIDVWN